jgi:hypothetical protein
MTRARGQSSRSLLNREYPHQVLVSSESVAGKTLDKVTAFHALRGFPTKTRAARQDDRWFTLCCFADRNTQRNFRPSSAARQDKSRIGFNMRLFPT